VSKLVDSIRSAQATVSDAFNQLAEDVESEETGEGDTNPTVEKVTVTYSDGSSVDFAPPGAGGGVITDDVPGGEAQELPPKSDAETPPQTGGGEAPGNAEQV
jgi:hypothetical protein